MEETTMAGVSGDGGSSGPYSQPKIWAKTGKDHKPSSKTQYPNGKFVEFDKCTKLNNGDTSNSCSQGSVDNVVKLRDKIYGETAKKTGKTIDEVMDILKRNNIK